MDHVQPRVRGGDHSAGNLVTACQGCNAAKGHRRLAEFLAAEPAARENFFRYARHVWPRLLRELSPRAAAELPIGLRAPSAGPGDRGSARICESGLFPAPVRAPLARTEDQRTGNGSRDRQHDRVRARYSSDRCRALRPHRNRSADSRAPPEAIRSIAPSVSCVTFREPPGQRRRAGAPQPRSDPLAALSENAVSRGSRGSAGADRSRRRSTRHAPASERRRPGKDLRIGIATGTEHARRVTAARITDQSVSPEARCLVATWSDPTHRIIRLMRHIP